MRTHDNNVEVFYSPTHTLYRISATDWMLQIPFITSTMKFQSDVSADNRSNQMGRVMPGFYFLFPGSLCSERSVFFVCPNKSRL